MAMWQSDRRLYLTKDKARVVEDGDPEAAFLLVGAGGSIPEEDAKRYGLLDKKAKAAPAESKAVDGPTENKSRRER